MQTFLPYPSFTKSAKVLDYRRLGNQRNEAKLILEILRGRDSQWKNHPAVKMWAGFELALSFYLDTIILEWMGRGYRNSIPLINYGGWILKPTWIGSKEFHASHRSNLLRKDYGYYSQFGWTEPTDLPYVWPTNK